MKILRYIILIVVLIILSDVLNAVKAAESSYDAVEAYYHMNLEELEKVAESDVNDDMSKLIKCYYLIHKNEDVVKAIEGLRQLYCDSQSDINVRINAGLTLARYTQIKVQRRITDKNDDYRQIYLDVINDFPDSREACVSEMYLSEDYFLEYSTDNDKLFTFIEGFIDSFNGTDKDLVPLHLLTADYYTELREDYRKAFEHLMSAYDIGLTSELSKDVVLYRLARIAHLKLAKYELAKQLYTEYLEQCPLSPRESFVREKLQELQRNGEND